MERKYFKKNSELTLLALPMAIMIFIFNYIPLYGLVLPFKDYKVNLGFLKSPWAGFENFKYLFSGADILRATKNTVLYNIVFLAGVTICGLIVALMLFQLGRRAVKTYQTVFFMPYFFSWVVVSYVVLSVLDMKYGVANKVLAMMGEKGIMWYNEPKYWPFILVFMHLWKNVGYRALVYYAALMNVDMTLYEAAAVTEAIVQYFGGTLHLLRALPKAWESGSVSGMKIPGGAALNMKWKDGVPTEIEIVGTRQSIKIALPAGNAVKRIYDTKNMRSVEFASENGEICFQIKGDSTIVIEYCIIQL